MAERSFMVINALQSLENIGKIFKIRCRLGFFAQNYQLDRIPTMLCSISRKMEEYSSSSNSTSGNCYSSSYR